MQFVARMLVHSPAFMVSIGFLARILYVAASHRYRFDLTYWSGFEMAQIGRHVALGHGFRLLPNCGPSAWSAPIYPGVIALTFRLFGVFSHAAAFFLLVFNSLFAALTSWTIYRIGRRVCNGTVAAWSGWIWACLPSSIYFSVFWIWETTLSAFLLSALLLLTLHMEGSDRLLPWCEYGLLWGIAALTNPSLLVWLPFAGSWLAYRLHLRGLHYLVPAIVSSAIFWLTLTPWLARNYFVFDDPLLIRSGFGMNLRAGNNPDAQGWWVTSYTLNNPVLLVQYKRLGEAGFDEQQGYFARQWIATHPSRFALLCLRRFAYFWIGIPHVQKDGEKNLFSLVFSVLSIGGLVLALRRRLPASFLLASLLVFYPLMYYITFPQPRYRHAIEPEMLLLAMYFVVVTLTPFRLSISAGKREAFS